MTTTAAQSALSLFGTALGGRYVIERELGRGGMATVFLAHDVQLDRRVAIKVLVPESGMWVGTERFLREIEVATALSHRRIVGVLDSGRVNAPGGGEGEGILFYVMPFVEGGSLRDRLDRSVQLPIDEAISITRQVAEAIAHAHRCGVIHRDIKPENILFGANGAMVADFGVARARSVAGAENLTRTGVAVGTPTYMSPEQAMGEKDVTVASDIYSLACVMYEMLAGQPPFTAPTRGIVLTRHVLDTPSKLSIMRPGVNDAIEDAIERAMAKSPADRFRSIEDFVAALTDHEAAARRRRDTPNVQPSPNSDSPRRRRRRWATTTAAALARVFVAASVWFGWRFLSLARPSADLPKTSIAVLYLDDRSPTKSLGALATSLTDGLIRQLDAVPQLDVASRNASLFFRGRSDLPLDSVARALKTGTLITGHIRPVGSNVRVELELWDGTTGWRLRRQRIEQSLADDLALQDSVASVMTRLLRRRLGEPTLEIPQRWGTRNPEAWAAMQRARRAVMAFDSTRRSGDTAHAIAIAAQADSSLAVAQRMDEYWADPHIERASLAYSFVRLVGAANAEFVARVDSGLSHAGTAVELAPNDWRALEVRGMLRYWQWLTSLAPDSAAAAAVFLSAEQDLTAAASRQRSQAGAWNALSHLLLNKGQLQRASMAAERAFELDAYLPNIDLTIYRLFAASLDMAYTEQARKWCGEGRRRYPTNFRFAECALWLSSLPDAKPDMYHVWTRYREYVNGSPERWRGFNALKGRMMVALAAERAGLPDSARHLVAVSMGDTIIDPRGELVNLAIVVYTRLGDRDKAIELLSRDVKARPARRTALANDRSWWLRDLRSDPRYQALIRRPQR